jgi:hypothetical protein
LPGDFEMCLCMEVCYNTPNIFCLYTLSLSVARRKKINYHINENSVVQLWILSINGSKTQNKKNCMWVPKDIVDGN